MRSLRQRLRVRLWIPEVDGSVTYVGVLGLEFRQSRFSDITVRWTIKLEFTPDGGEPQVRQIGTINRSMTDVRPEGVGLTLQEGRQLLRGIECQVIANQVTFTRSASALARIAAGGDNSRTCERSVFRPCSAPIASEGAEFAPVPARWNRGIRHPSSHWESSFHPRRLQKFGSCSPNWVRGCLIGRRPACWESAASTECGRVARRSGDIQSDTREWTANHETQC